MKGKSVLQVLSRSHAIKILSSLSKKPMRFLDLKDVCKSNRTRSVRLKELEKKGLVRAVPKLIERRAYIFYEITALGKEALDLAEKLLRLENEGTREKWSTEDTRKKSHNGDPINSEKTDPQLKYTFGQ